MWRSGLPEERPESCVDDRQCQCKFGAFTQAGENAKSTAVGLGDGARNGQAETGTILFMSYEGVKNCGEIFFGNSRPVVENLDIEQVIFPPSGIASAALRIRFNSISRIFVLSIKNEGTALSLFN